MRNLGLQQGDNRLIIELADEAGVCDTKKTVGVEVGVNFGAELAIKAANVNTPTDELLDLKIAVCSPMALR